MGEGGPRFAVAVIDAFAARPGEHGDRALGNVQRPDLVDAGHRDEQRVTGLDQVPRRGHGGLFGFRGGAGELVELLAGPGDRGHFVRRKVHLADSVVSRVRHIERLAVRRKREALRLAEGGLVGCAVGEPLQPAADRRL